MIVYVAEMWDDEYGLPGGAVGVARTFQGALDTLVDFWKNYQATDDTITPSQKIIPYGDNSYLTRVQLIEKDGFSREYSIREMELKE